MLTLDKLTLDAPLGTFPSGGGIDDRHKETTVYL